MLTPKLAKIMFPKPVMFFVTYTYLINVTNMQQNAFRHFNRRSLIES